MESKLGHFPSGVKSGRRETPTALRSFAWLVRGESGTAPRPRLVGAGSSPLPKRGQGGRSNDPRLRDDPADVSRRRHVECRVPRGALGGRDGLPVEGEGFLGRAFLDG